MRYFDHFLWFIDEKSTFREAQQPGYRMIQPPPHSPASLEQERI
jgi:hypothetical protein